MKFQFKIQPFQTEAAESVVRVFAGQPNVGTSKYRRDIGSEKELTEVERLSRRGYLALTFSSLSEEEKRGVEEEYEAAYRNEKVQLPKEELLKNIRTVQTANNIKYSDDLAAGLGAVSLDVEMETGTGKTYVYIKTMGTYSPDWAISFKKGAVKHIFFIAETKGSMDSLELRPIEHAKISCAKKLFNEISTSGVKYHDVDSYQSLLTVMETL